MKRNEPEGDVKKKKLFSLLNGAENWDRVVNICTMSVNGWMCSPLEKKIVINNLKVYFIYLSKHLVYFTYNLQAEPSPTTGSFSKFQTVQGSGGAAAFLLTRGYASGNTYTERKASCFEYKYAGGSSSTSGSLATEHVVMLY